MCAIDNIYMRVCVCLCMCLCINEQCCFSMSQETEGAIESS